MTNMTRHFISCALLLGATLAASPALQAAELKIGYVNFQRLLEESPQARAAQQALEGEFLPRQREVAAQRKSLDEKRDRITREAAVMSEADRIKAEREVRDLELNVTRRFNELQEVQSYARANGYQLIVSDGVVYAAEGIDITPQVVAALKAKAPATPPKT